MFNKLSFAELLRELKRYPSIRMLEIGTGGWPGASHIDVAGLLSDSGQIREYRSALADAGLGISAFSCHGNPVHPVRAVADRDDVPRARTPVRAQRFKKGRSLSDDLEPRSPHRLESRTRVTRLSARATRNLDAGRSQPIAPT